MNTDQLSPLEKAFGDLVVQVWNAMDEAHRAGLNSESVGKALKTAISLGFKNRPKPEEK